MNIFPAIDLYEAKVVRLFKGDYDQMTVYSDDPVSVARSFEEAGAEYLHVVDLEGARDGSTANFGVISDIISSTSLKTEVGGGIRSEDVIKKYLDAGALRVILGTAALENHGFLTEMAKKYGGRIAVSVDIKGGFVATHGWTNVSLLTCFDFVKSLSDIGIKTIICTDISRDGAMQGTNLGLYEELSRKFGMDIIASGGVSTIEDIKALRSMSLYGAILGKAIYSKSVDLKEALEAAK